MRMIKRMLVATVLAGVVGMATAADHGAPEAKGPTPTESLHRLVDGNGRYILGAPAGKGRDESRRTETAKGQHPFAAVLSCADSRVPVEVVFDQGLGDVFSVRVAGNIADNSEMASLEYGIEHLHIPVVVVMGHTKCGAVGAALAGGNLPPHIAKLVAQITPATEEAKVQNPGLTGDALAGVAVKRNVLMSMKTLLSESEIVREAVEAGKLQLVGAVYDVATGKVDFVGEHPRQIQIMASAEVKAKHEHAGAGATPAATAPAVAEKTAEKPAVKPAAADAASADARPHEVHGH